MSVSVLSAERRRRRVIIITPNAADMTPAYTGGIFHSKIQVFFKNTLTTKSLMPKSFVKFHLATKLLDDETFWRLNFSVLNFSCDHNFIKISGILAKNWL